MTSNANHLLRENEYLKLTTIDTVCILMAKLWKYCSIGIDVDHATKFVKPLN